MRPYHFQREMGWGLEGVGQSEGFVLRPPHEAIGAHDAATWADAETKVSPRWVRGRSGQYTYYCVSTTLNHLDVAYALGLCADGASRDQDGKGPPANPASRWFSDQMVGTHATVGERQAAMRLWLDSVALKKRMLFLHGMPDTQGRTNRLQSYRDAQSYATVPLTTSLHTGVQKAPTHLNPTEAEKKARWRSSRAEVSLGNNIINESILADGIDVILEQEFNDGQVRSEVVTWLPKLDIFVRKSRSIAGRSGDIRPGADANAHFTSWDAAAQAQLNQVEEATVTNTIQLTDASYLRYPRLCLKSAEYTHDDDGVERGATAPMFVKNVMIRPLTPSEDLLPSTRQEIIWKPPLGIFDVGHNIPTTTHELHMVIPNDYQTRCFDFGRQNLDATALGSGSGGRIMPFGLGATPSAENKNQVYLRIEGFELYCGMAMGPRADEAKFVLDMREYRMTPYAIPEQQTVLPHTYPFNLSPTTASVCVAFQSAKAGNGTTSLSKFIVPTQYTQRGAETALDRFYVTFANQNRPREENESKLSYRGFSHIEMGTQVAEKEQAVQYFTQRYMETMINAGQLFRPGGCESFEEWIERGAYYNWVWPRDGGDLSTRFHVNVAFKARDANLDNDGVKEVAKQLLYRGWTRHIKRGAPGQEAELINDINILVFDMVPKAFSLSITNGKVTGAETTAAMINDAARKMLRVNPPMGAAPAA